MKIKNIFIISGILLVLLFGSYLIQTTYSKFRKNLTTNTQIEVAGWNIKVNDESIVNKSTLTADISPIFPGSTNIAAGVIAPGAEGYYDITIDASNVNVSFNYLIFSTVSNDSNVTDLITTGYEINPTVGSTVIPYSSETGITGSIPFGTASTIIRIFIKWDDSVSATMDNASDTTAATNSGTQALMTTTLTFTQINS